MKATVEYNILPTPNNVLEMDDIGNIALECYSGVGFYYMIIRTVMGVAHIYTWGVVIPEVCKLQDGFFFLHKECQYKEQKILGEIDRFINDSKKNIIEVKVIPIDVALENLVDINSLVSSGVLEVF